jgi:hypothetical protein
MAKQSPATEATPESTYSYTRNFKNDDGDVIASIDISFPYYGTEEYDALFENEEAARAFHVGTTKKIFSSAIAEHLKDNPGDYEGAQALVSNGIVVPAPSRKTSIRTVKRTLSDEQVAGIQSQFNLDADQLAALAAQMGVNLTAAE